MTGCASTTRARSPNRWSPTCTTIAPKSLPTSRADCEQPAPVRPSRDLSGAAETIVPRFTRPLVCWTAEAREGIERLAGGRRPAHRQEFFGARVGKFSDLRGRFYRLLCTSSVESASSRYASTGWVFVVQGSTVLLGGRRACHCAAWWRSDCTSLTSPRRWSARACLVSPGGARRPHCEVPRRLPGLVRPAANFRSVVFDLGLSRESPDGVIEMSRPCPELGRASVRSTCRGWRWQPAHGTGDCYKEPRTGSGPSRSWIPAACTGCCSCPDFHPEGASKRSPRAATRSSPSKLDFVSDSGGQ